MVFRKVVHLRIKLVEISALVVGRRFTSRRITLRTSKEVIVVAKVRDNKAMVVLAKDLSRVNRRANNSRVSGDNNHTSSRVHACNLLL